MKNAQLLKDMFKTIGGKVFKAVMSAVVPVNFEGTTVHVFYSTEDKYAFVSYVIVGVQNKAVIVLNTAEKRWIPQIMMDNAEAKVQFIESLLRMKVKEVAPNATDIQTHFIQ